VPIAPSKPRLAVLIDADNVSHKISDRLFDRIAKLGDPSVRRVYGDFSSPHSKGWEAAVVKHAIVPKQQFANVPGKNATDITLVVDAMDLLYAGNLDGFCIVSSDSDFTRLATRLREGGVVVYGVGRSETPSSFRNACSQFIDSETLQVEKPAVKAKAIAKAADPIKVPAAPVPPQTASAPPAAASLPLEDAERLILRALGETSAGRKWIGIASVISEVRRLDPRFRPTSYGSGLFTELVDRTSCLETRDAADGGKEMRMKPARGAAPSTSFAGPPPP
jgi:predicted nuclease of predicted toxin-antitoxin system